MSKLLVDQVNLLMDMGKVIFFSADHQELRGVVNLSDTADLQGGSSE